MNAAIPLVPVLLATWPIAAPAVDAAWPALNAGGDALDAVEATCRFAEADPLNHSVGVGGLPDRDGHVSLDAAVMLSPARRGGVCLGGPAPASKPHVRCTPSRIP